MNPFRFLLVIIGIFLIVSGALGYWVYNTVSHNLPSLEQLENPSQNLATKVVSADGEVLDHFYIERRLSLPYDSIPRDFINALIATEDKDFYTHWGVRTERIFKAVVKRILYGRMEGASTITMQLARNLFLNHDRNLKRKVRESFIAIQIEKSYTKEEIIEMYANTVIFGRGAYGIQVASNQYFNKEPKELTTAECAYLVGILKRPEKYNGLRNLQQALERRNLVLKLMLDQKYIDKEKYEKSIEEPINLEMGNFSKSRITYKAPHFVEYARKFLKNNPEILKNYDLYRDGLTIYTTLDSRIQKHAERAAENHMKGLQEKFDKAFSWKKAGNKKLLEKYIKRSVRKHPEYIAARAEADKKAVEKRLRNTPRFIDSIKNAISTVQCGIAAIDVKTGSILAMVGASPKFMKEQSAVKYSLNHATQIRRQPGSAFKPFVYASCLEKGMGLDSKIECGPYSYKLPSGQVWSPRGDGDCSKGDSTTLLEGLRRSINTVAARLITQYTEPGDVVSLAKRAGIKSKMKAVPALALGGGGEVSPIEMATAYSTFANDGIYVEPFAITRIEDKYGNVIYRKNAANNMKGALSADIARKISYMLREVVLRGTGSRVKKYLTNCEAAGKTGTTNDYADAWFTGFTPQIAASAWVGFDDRRITFTGGYAYASQAAVPLWARMMSYIYTDPTIPYKQKSFSLALEELRELEVKAPEIELELEGSLDSIIAPDTTLRPERLAPGSRAPRLNSAQARPDSAKTREGEIER